MFKLEKEFRADYNLIAGVDEAGRGPLAGPVVAGAVIFKNIPKIKDLKDSKLLKAREREEIFEKIKLSALEFQISICDVEYINQNNILRATLKAMQDAILKLKTIPELILIDGTFTIPQIFIKQLALIKGESKSFSIAAGSIMAKVARDKIMLKLDQIYPQYGFKKHKGYGTKEHLEALNKYGPSPVHRKFKPVLNLQNNLEQLSLILNA